jgi:hypothetical protein
MSLFFIAKNKGDYPLLFVKFGLALLFKSSSRHSLYFLNAEIETAVRPLFVLRSTGNYLLIKYSATSIIFLLTA